MVMVVPLLVLSKMATTARVHPVIVRLTLSVRPIVLGLNAGPTDVVEAAVNALPVLHAPMLEPVN